MAEHKINCPNCAQHLAVPEELAGQQIDCPSCNKPMTLPGDTDAFYEKEDERIEEPRQSPALIVGIVAGVLVFGGVGVFLLMGQDQPADEPEVATLPSAEDKSAGSTGQQPGATPGMELDPNDPFGGMMVPGMGFESEEEAQERLAAEIKIINDRLAKGEPLNQYNEAGLTELMVAVEANDAELAKRLLEKKANPNATEKNVMGFGSMEQTSLHFAAMRGNRELCEVLVEGGADINQKQKAQYTALDIALDELEATKSDAEKQKYEAVAMYLKGKGGTSMPPDQRRKAMMTFMMKDMQKMGMGMMPGMMPPGMGMNPFGMGMNPFGMEDDPMLEDEIKTINERLAKDEPLNQYNDTGDTELMIAARAGDLDLAKRLLEKKANANLKVNLEPGDFGAGETALHIAAIRENKTMCELLYNNGALLNVKDEKGFTPLDAILSNFDTGPDPFTGKMINPKMTRKGKATIAYLQSKGGKSMTAKQRADAWNANDPFMDMMMQGGDPFGLPGGMPPNPFMMPPEGNPYAAPKSRNSTPPKRR